jgi:ubiquinone/menaquinone biosynthesis C-methylase UbiE
MTHETYTHGHHESVLRSHTSRNVANSAGYLAGELRPGLDLLDVGCGPGTLTVDFARLLSPGRVVGMDRSEEVLATARRHAVEEGVEVTFESGDVYALGYDDASFDVVHAHQVLQHLGNPVAALNEMRRVTRPGGIVAVRDGDYSCLSWAPLDPRLDRWLELYRTVARKNGGEPDAARFLKRWALEAGFSEVRVSSSTWTFADSESCRWWGGLWADRCELSDLGDQIVMYRLADRSELSAIAKAWRHWAEQPDAYFSVPHGEVIARA